MRKPFTSSNYYIITISILWLITLATIGILQKVGAHFGFKVWALGEDRVWLSLIQGMPEKSLAHGWWATNDRNPLSAWWWLAISPFVRYSNWALYFIRKCFDPILAVCIFLLLDQLGRKKYQTFAFSVSVIVLLWNFSQYHESVLWDMLGALALTLLTLLFYCRYVDSNRSNGSDLALAMLCYLIAISTYTIQSGAVIGIAVLAFYRKPSQVPFLISDRIKKTINDTAYFLTIFIVYNCIWYTVNRNSGVYYKFNLSLFLTQISDSLRQFLFHPSYSIFINKIWKSWSMSAIVATWLSTFLILCFILFKCNSRMLSNTDDDDATRIPLGWVVMILLSISLPTILLESTSNIWVPGTRSLMIQQIWQPLLYVSFIFILAHFLSYFFRKSKKIITLTGVAFLGATTFLVGLDYNHRLVLRTAYQRNLVAEIKKLGLPHSPSNQPAFLVKFTDPSNDDLNSISVPITMFSATVFRNSDVTLRPLVSFDWAGFFPYWKVSLGNDQEGATNVRTLGDTRITPYKNLWIVFFDGKKITIPEKIEQMDLKGLQVIWNRNEPINQCLNHQRSR